MIQTPTSQAVRLAEADLGVSPDRRRTTSFVASLAERLSRGMSFQASHSDLQKLDLDVPPRARPLAFSKSQPNLKAAASAATPPAGLVVLGKVARRRSRRYLQSEDGTPVSPHWPGTFSWQADRRLPTQQYMSPMQELRTSLTSTLSTNLPVGIVDATPAFSSLP